MGIQYQTDEQGNRVAVVIPLAEWEAIRERLSGHDTCRGQGNAVPPGSLRPGLEFPGYGRLRPLRRRKEGL
jgi:hypothetical protein